MKSSRREPTLIHLFFVVMFFVMGEGGTAWSRSQWQKHFGHQAMTFLPFFATSFLRPGRHTQNSRGISFYVTTQQTTMAAPKMRIKTLVPLVLCLLFGAAASRQDWSHHQQQQQQQQPHKRWTMVNRWEEGELHNRSALFRCELLHIFTGGKKMINDGRVMCRTTMPLRWMNEGLLPPCLLCYVYNYNNDTRRWNQKKKKRGKVGNKLFENL